ncbi:hypothetical protein KFL_001520220 [Klebsormidium nitens]|uniref:ABC transporter domain-containing protein n=2 Tax=Klebsormidium TaxID=3174 RepID=A0A1Y1I0R1_KLENI|nr:hypothetical protein KFL_001520220 [Klebsormidium nitens]|eukprot:GAQ83552.1 hypothetical protein KFL_001520220 [Klebsormidium nitens]
MSYSAAFRSSWPSNHPGARIDAVAGRSGNAVLELSLAVWWQLCKRWETLSHSHSQLVLARPLASAALPLDHTLTDPPNNPTLSSEGNVSTSSNTFSIAAISPFSDQKFLASRSLGSTAERSSWWRPREPPLEETSGKPMEPLPVWTDASYFGNDGLPPPPKLMASQLACIRGGEVIFRDINLSLHSGSAVNMTGPNGSGKTSMLRVLAGFIPPSAGRLLYEGVDLKSDTVIELYMREINIMFGKDAIKPRLSVHQNVHFWATYAGRPDRTDWALDRVGLGQCAQDVAAILSMGQRRRLQLARLLTLPRQIWLLDEPSVGLDTEGVRILEQLIHEHRLRGGIVCVATHLPVRMENALHLRFPARSARLKSVTWDDL